MKRQIFFVLLAMLTTALGGMKAQPVEISDAAGLVAFANRVNNGEGGLDAVLTADIDMSGITDFPGIGNDGSNLKRYHATFDGQGHRIKNLHMTGADIALFPVTSDNTIIKNLIIDASCSFIGTGRVAAFVSACNWDEWGSRKVEFYNCGNEAEVEGTAKNCGGLLGCNYDGDIAIVMKNCFNAGHIKGAGECGALSGWIGTNSANSIDHCYNIAEVEGLDSGNMNNLFRGSVSLWISPDNDCYDTHYSYNTGSVYDAAKVASGELCWMLNQGQRDVEWVQTLGSDYHPIPAATGHRKVYRNGTFNCDGSLKSGEISFSNTSNVNTDSHDFDANDICTVCNTGREPELINGAYQIRSIGNLVWFSAAVNAGHALYNAVLTSDIVQRSAIYTPIGNPTYPYRGTFDGQGHTINLSLGDNGVWDNQGVFGVVGGGVQIRNLIVTGIVRGRNYVGGIVGSSTGSGVVLMENCGNEATVEALERNAAGIIGCNLSGSISYSFINCYNSGYIYGPNDNGAMTGWTGSAHSVYTNCYNTGTVTAGNGQTDFARYDTGNPPDFINCYHVYGFQGNSSTTEVTVAQRNSGNLRDRLNTGANANWYQYSPDDHPLPFDYTHPSEGTFYLQNVGSGLWWGAANDWGTKASLVEHPEYVILHDNGDGRFYMETQVSNGGDNIYFNGEWMDNNNKKLLTFTRVGEYYTITSDGSTYGYNGTSTVLGNNVDASTDNGKWRLFTKADLLAAFPSATKANPVDATFLVYDHSFGRNNRNEGHWTFSDAAGDDGSNSNPRTREYWNKSGATVKQTLTELPAGYYKLTVTALTRTNFNAQIMVNGKLQPIVGVGSGEVNNLGGANTWFAAGNGRNEVIFQVENDYDPVTIGIKAASNTADYWTVWRDFELAYLGSDPSDMTLADNLAAQAAMYLYNPASGKFLSRGDDWGTRAVIDDYGLPFAIESNGENIRLKFVDNNLYLGAPGGNADTWGYTDVPAGDRAREFEVAADGDCYTLRNTHADNLYLYVYNNFFVPIDGNPAGNAADAGARRWQFKTQAERDAIIQQSVNAGVAAIANKAGLKATSEDALKSILSDIYTSEDKTSLIQSPTLVNGTDGWTFTKNPSRGENLTSNEWATECFQGAGTLTQTVTGLEPGFYRVTVNALYRNGSNANCWLLEHDGGYKGMSTAYLEANGTRSQIPTWASDAENNGSPNSMQRASELMGEGKYLSEVYAYVDGTGTLNLALGFPSSIANGWFIAKNVTLTYYRAKLDVTDVTRDDQNLSFETGNTTNWTKNNSSVSGQTEVRNDNMFPGKDGDYYFNTWDDSNQGTEKTLWLRHNNFMMPGDPGTFMMTADIAGYWDSEVVVQVRDGSDNVLGTVTHRLDADPNDGNWGANTPTRERVYFTLPAKNSYISIYVYNTTTGTAFFKADNFRFYRVNGSISDGLLPNPSFELADASGTAETARTISNLSGTGTIPGTGETLFGWTLPTMQGTTTGTGQNSNNRIGLGSASTLDVYSYVTEDNLNGIPTPDDGDIYFYNGQNMRNSGGEQVYTLSTQTTTSLPVGLYSLSLRYKAMGAYQTAWPKTGDSNLTLNVEIGGTELAAATSANFPYYDRNEGVARGNRNKYLAQQPWETLKLIFYVETPGVATINIKEQFCQAYSTDIILDNVQLKAYAVPEPPVHKATTNTASYTLYGAAENECYLMNAATGLFLGGGNAFGTQASLVEHGIPFNIVKPGSAQRIYRLSSPAYEGNKNSLNGTYIDGSPTYFYIDYVADGRYTLSTDDGSAYLTVKGGDASQPIVDNTGTSGTSLLNQWYIIKKADRELNLLEETTDGDASFYIPNASFSRNQNTNSNKNTWTETHASSMNLSDVTNVAESYHSTFEVKKTVSVPNGTYRFRAQGFYRQDGTDDTHLPYFFVSTPSGAEVTSTFIRRTDNVAGSGGGMAESSRAFLNGKYYSDYVTVRVTDNLLTVGCRLEYNSNLWCCWDNFELQMLTHDEGTADIADINNYITAMEGAQGFQPGEYATYAVTEAKAIQQAVDAGFPYSYDKVAAYLAATYPTNADDVNAIYRPDFAYYRNAHIAGSDRAVATGWSNTTLANTGVVGLQFNEPANPGDGTTNPGLGGLTSKKALYLRDGNETTYGSVAGYTMPLLYGTQYRLAFKYGGWGGTGTVTATIKDGSGNVVQTWTLTTTGTANSSTDAWQDFDETFSTTDAGNYTLTLAAAGAQAAISDFSLLPVKATEIAVIDDYYFYNNQEGQYLASGGPDANDAWGTHAVLDDDGLDITLTQSGTGYLLDTKISNGGNAHYLNPDILMTDGNPGVWTLIPTGETDTYYLRGQHGYLTSNGRGLKSLLISSATPTAASKWTLKTRAQRIAELEAMTADGTTTMDATFLIKGANFSRNDTRVMANWTAVANRNPDGDLALNQGTWFYWGAPNRDASETHATYNANWNVQAYHMKTFEVSQTVEGVPAGVYTLSAQGFYSGEAADLPYFFIQDATVEGEGVLAVDYSQYLHQEQTMVEMGTGNVGNVGNMFNAGRYFYRDGKFWNNLPSVRVCGNKLKLGAKQDGTVQDALWTVFDNFRLTYRPFVDADLEPEADLAAEYQSVNVGDGPFEIPDDDPYYTMLTAAQHDAATATTNTQRAVALIELLKADDDYVNFARLNAFKTASSTKFTLGNGQYPGMVLTVKGGKGATGDAITMGFTDAAGSIYPQGLTFTPVPGNTNCFRLSYTDGDGQTVYLCTGDAALGNGRNDQIRTTTTVGDALLFRIIPQTTGDGVWYLKNTAADTRMGLNDTGFYTGTGTAGANAFNFSFAEAQMAPAVTLTVKSENQFSTLMLPFEADCPVGVLACKVDDIDGNNIVLETFNKFEANVPYIVYAENGFSGSLQNYGAAFTDETITGNHLTGTATTDATVSIPVGCYVLSAKTYTTGRKVGFYRVTTDNVKLPKNRAYFSIGSSAGVKEAYFFGDGDDETGLSDLVSGEKEVEGIYDLRGVRQPRMQKGVNIIRFTDGTTRKVQIK